MTCKFGIVKCPCIDKSPDNLKDLKDYLVVKLGQHSSNHLEFQDHIDSMILFLQKLKLAAQGD